MTENNFDFIVFYGNKMLIKKSGDDFNFPKQIELPFTIPTDKIIHPITIHQGMEIKPKGFDELRVCKEGFNPGEMEEVHVKSFYLNEDSGLSLDSQDLPIVPEFFKWVGVRESFDFLSEQNYLLVCKASQMINWDKSYQFCPKCGCKLELRLHNMKACPSCRAQYFPRISPAMIVRITRGNDEVFLVHPKNMKQADVMGLVAGFLEVGESVEECVHREVLEETGLRIKNLKYFGNQPWPYPSGLMIGFTAEYLSGEVKLQEEELACGGFYNRNKLPKIPSKLSMARMLIDDWLKE